MACSPPKDLLRYLMHLQGFTVYTYVDDMIGISESNTAQEAFHYLFNLLKDLKFSISDSKLPPPANESNCLGIIVDTITETIHIPPQKQKEVIGDGVE